LHLQTILTISIHRRAKMNDSNHIMPDVHLMFMCGENVSCVNICDEANAHVHTDEECGCFSIYAQTHQSHITQHQQASYCRGACHLYKS
jgi:hypothetical protein